MRKDVAKKWVKALRSGKYKQGKSWLKQINKKGIESHCCLGVLCELYNDEMKKNHKKTLKTSKITIDEWQAVRFNKQKSELPSVVKKWAGMRNSLGSFDYKTKNNEIGFECLADLNDTGCKFKTIAKVIEKNVDNL